MPLKRNSTMRNIMIVALSVLLMVSCKKTEQLPEPIDYVNPNIGSVHGRWFFYTPASIPFGMAKLAPHTNAYGSQGGWMPCGYDDRHNSIEGFGHFHEFQIGGVVVMPTIGEVKTVPGTLEDPDEGYRSRFNKKEEVASPGYYKVKLEDYNIDAELTATARVGYHRYKFPKSTDSHMIFDIGHKQGESSHVSEAFMKMVGEKEFQGYVVTYPEYAKFCDPGKRVKMFFAGQISKAPAKVDIFVDHDVTPNKRSTLGKNNGMVFTFSTEENEVIEMQIGLSYTNMQNARANLIAETKGNSFDKVKNKAAKTWNDMLGRIVVEGGEYNDRVKFYTGLYHALLGRGLASDVDGKYPMNNGKIGQIPLDERGRPQYNHYNTDGIWGGFWNLGQVWALAYPDYLSSYVQSNIDFYKETGWLHDGVAAGVHTNGVQTNYQGLMIAAAYNCGIRDFDLKTGYQAAFDNETKYRGRVFGSGKYDLGYFVQMGYIPSKDTVISNGWSFNFGASHTLEFAFSSYAVSQMAKDLGKDDDAQLLLKQAKYYRNLFDPETKFIRPKEMDGSFIKEYDPMKAWKGFQEGNGFQYTWYAPQDPHGLISLVGKKLFNERLDMMFKEAQKSMFGGGKEVDSFSGIEKLYNHGNQPCLHDAWLYNYSGQPWKTQYWTRTICNEFYGTTGMHGYGVGQDEDQGQLGAWYVMASMGLFDVQGHASQRPVYQIGSTLFDKITIHLNQDYFKRDKIVIDVQNNSPENVYVQEVMIGDQPNNNCWVYRDELFKAGSLIIKMGSTPNESMGEQGEPSPPAMLK
ncbi:glycoside hydrolase family 92 protein [Puteibacter caeruleilacunae]|nr:glycoside hydrolase family 92 protein [Puteibacter caeruleilacunae]